MADEPADWYAGAGRATSSTPGCSVSARRPRPSRPGQHDISAVCSSTSAPRSTATTGRAWTRPARPATCRASSWPGRATDCRATCRSASTAARWSLRRRIADQVRRSVELLSHPGIIALARGRTMWDVVRARPGTRGAAGLRSLRDDAASRASRSSAGPVPPTRRRASATQAVRAAAAAWLSGAGFDSSRRRRAMGVGRPRRR